MDQNVAGAAGPMTLQSVSKRKGPIEAGLPDRTSIIASIALSTAMVAVAAWTEPDSIVHWSTIPTWVCGIIVGPDFISWVRSRLDLFDPLGVVGALAYYLFFVAPLLTAATNYHTRGLPVPRDWLEWIGWVSAISACGLALYRATVALVSAVPLATSMWHLDRRRMAQAVAVALPITLAFQVYIMSVFGGLGGLVDTVSSGSREAFAGTGWLFVLGDSFPVLVMLAALMTFRQALSRSRWQWILVLILMFVVMRVFVGGLRGSRSNTVWSLFWLLGAIHLWIRRVTWRAVVPAALAVLAFMYLYGFYKSQGRTALETIQSVEAMREAEVRTGRTGSAILLGDLARTEIQAVLLSRVRDGVYEPALGTTYLEALSLVIPVQILGSRPVGKVQKGTEALYGREFYVAGQIEASQVYGLVGESMLNFPPELAPLAFVAVAFAVVQIRRRWLGLHRDDPRRLLHPFWVAACLVLLSSDSGNVVVFLVRTVLVPWAFVWSCARTYRVKSRA